MINGRKTEDDKIDQETLDEIKLSLETKNKKEFSDWVSIIFTNSTISRRKKIAGLLYDLINKEV